MLTFCLKILKAVQFIERSLERYGENRKCHAIFEPRDVGGMLGWKNRVALTLFDQIRLFLRPHSFSIFSVYGAGIDFVSFLRRNPHPPFDKTLWPERQPDALP